MSGTHSSELLGFWISYIVHTKFLRTEADPASETARFLVIKNFGQLTKPRNPVFLSVIQRRQNPLDTYYNPPWSESASEL
jgi:hypothetical protein